MTVLLFTVLTLCALGILAAVILYVVAQKFKVEEDPRIDEVEKIHSMIMRNEKKRYQFPPVLRLSSCAFKHERLMPLINKYSF